MKQIFLLGAGFTKAIKTDAPLTSDFVKCLDLSSFPGLEDFRDDDPDIELMLSYIDLKCLQAKKQNEDLWKKYLHKRNEIVNQIVALVGLQKLGVKREEDNSLLKRFVANKNIPDHTCLLTLNYDCVLDQGLWLSKRWSPRGGYLLSSFPIDDDLKLEEESKPKKNSELGDILLLKLHGSINFKLSNPEILDNKHKIYIEMSEELFSGQQIISNPPGVTHSKYSYVLIPSYLKVFNNDIYCLWRKAIERVKEAETLTIIGCSLREEDTNLRFLLSHFGHNEGRRECTVEVVDKCSGTFDKIYRTLKIERLMNFRPTAMFKHFCGLDDYLDR